MRAPTRVCEKRSPNFLPLLFAYFPFFLFPAFLVPSFFLSYQSFLLLSSSFLLPSLSLAFPFFSSGGVIQNPKVFSLLFLHCKPTVTQRKNALFCDFFTLWGNIDPYTNRGRTKEAHPILQISFTAEANLI